MFAGDVHGAREMQGLISCHEEEIENLKVNIQTKRNRWNKFRLLFQIIIVFSGCSSQFLFIRSALFCFYHSKLSYNRNNVLDLLRKSIKTICLYIIKIHLRSNRIDRRRNWKRYRGGGGGGGGGLREEQRVWAMTANAVEWICPSVSSFTLWISAINLFCVALLLSITFGLIRFLARDHPH